MTPSASPRPPGFSATLGSLVSYRLRELLNLYRFGWPGTWAWTASILAVGLSFAWFDYYFFWRLIGSVQEKLEFLAPFMLHQLVHTLFLSFFGLLALSSMSASISVFFLSREIPLLVSAPISPSAFISQRFVLVFFQSSWMIMVFGTPPFLAYARRLGLGADFLAGWAPAFVLLLVIPVLLGGTMGMLLMRLLPASRVKQAVSFLSLALAALIIILFRMSRPERLFMDVPQEEVMGFVQAMTVPAASFLPTSWATTAVVSLAEGAARSTYFENLGYLTAGVLAAALIFYMVFRFTYGKGLASVDEGQVRRIRRDMGRIEGRFSRLEPVLGSYLTKDLLVFLRDPARWTQTFLLGALVVLYIYNAYSFPLGGFWYRNLVAFMNLAISGFVLSSLCVRFVYPSVSLEGRSLWVTMAAPVPMRRFFLAKYIFASVPLSGVALLLSVATNLVMGVRTQMTVLFAGTTLAMALALVGLNLGMGAVFPRFDYENEEQIMASPGGVLTMIISLFYIGLMVILLAAPVYRIFATRLGLSALTRGDALFGLAGAAALSAVVGIVPVGWGLRKVGEWGGRSH